MTGDWNAELPRTDNGSLKTALAHIVVPAPKTTAQLRLLELNLFCLKLKSLAEAGLAGRAKETRRRWMLSDFLDSYVLEFNLYFCYCLLPVREKPSRFMSFQ